MGWNRLLEKKDKRMNQETRSKYADYISEGLRLTMNETGIGWPSDMIIITKPWCELAECDSLLGYDIFVTELESEQDFNLAFKSYHEKAYKLLKAFNDYMQLTTLEIGE